MKTLQIIVIIYLSLSIVSSISINVDYICNPVTKGNDTPYQNKGGPHDDSNKGLLEIKPCECVYPDSSLNMTITGNCFFTCNQQGQVRVNASTFNSFCEEMNRTGRFCGQCQEGYGLAAYSYHYISCIPCKDYGYKNWIRYFTVALLPLTVFYIILLLLRFNITSSGLNGALVILQLGTSPIQMLVLEMRQLYKGRV